MITILASMAGFFSSIIPEIIKFFKDKNDKKHEIAIFDRQIEYNKILKKERLQEIETLNDISEAKALYATYKSGTPWVDALNASVRPVLAYSFFIIYFSVKYAKYAAVTRFHDIVDYVELIWNNDDQAIFVGIISFYYGQRTFFKANLSKK